jgi:hAT family C-terminal dimerisation region
MSGGRSSWVHSYSSSDPSSITSTVSADGLSAPVISRQSHNPFLDDFDALKFWSNAERVAKYPSLAGLARRVQCIQGSSNDVERVSAYPTIVVVLPVLA